MNSDLIELFKETKSQELEKLEGPPLHELIRKQAETFKLPRSIWDFRGYHR